MPSRSPGRRRRSASPSIMGKTRGREGNWHRAIQVPLSPLVGRSLRPHTPLIARAQHSAFVASWLASQDQKLDLEPRVLRCCGTDNPHLDPDRFRSRILTIGRNCLSRDLPRYRARLRIGIVPEDKAPEGRTPTIATGIIRRVPARAIAGIADLSAPGGECAEVSWARYWAWAWGIDCGAGNTVQLLLSQPTPLRAINIITAPCMASLRIRMR